MKKRKLATCCLPLSAHFLVCSLSSLLFYLLSPPLSLFSRLFSLFLPVLHVLSPSQPSFSRLSPLFSSIVERLLLHGWLCLVLSSPHSSIGDRLLLHSRLCPRALISTHPRQPGRVSSLFLFSFKECPVPNSSPARLHNHNPLSIFAHNLIIFQNPPQTTPEYTQNQPKNQSLLQKKKEILS